MQHPMQAPEAAKSRPILSSLGCWGGFPNKSRLLNLKYSPLAPSSHSQYAIIAPFFSFQLC
jgi:hypothetical protein